MALFIIENRDNTFRVPRFSRYLLLPLFFFFISDLFVARGVFVSVDSRDVRSFNLRRPGELFRKTVSLRELGRYATMSPRARDESLARSLKDNLHNLSVQRCRRIRSLSPVSSQTAIA